MSQSFLMHGEQVKLTVKTDSSTVEWVFTRGHCHSFALAVHKLTGWQLFGLFREDNDMAYHVVNRTPDGKLFDITGTEVESQWPGLQARPISREDIERWEDQYNTQGYGYVPSNATGAIKFAKRALETI